MEKGQAAYLYKCSEPLLHLTRLQLSLRKLHIFLIKLKLITLNLRFCFQLFNLLQILLTSVISLPYASDTLCEGFLKYFL